MKGFQKILKEFVNLAFVYGRIGRKTQQNTIISKHLLMQNQCYSLLLNAMGLLQAPCIGPPSIKFSQS